MPGVGRPGWAGRGRRCSSGRAGRVTQGGNKAWQGGLWSQGGKGTRGPAAGALFLSSRPARCVTEAEVGPRKLWPKPRLAVPLRLRPHPSPAPVQGYKMDDLLTSYVQQMLSTVNKQRDPRTSVPASP